MELNYTGTAPALERGLRIIELISAYDKPLSFTELERLTGIPKATLNRLLKVLCGMNYLAKSPGGKYIPGKRCGIIGRPDSVESAMRHYGPDIVRRVCELTDNTCILFYWDGKQTRVAAKEMHEMSLSMQPVDNVSADYIKTPWGWIFLFCPELSPEITVDGAAYQKHYDYYLEHGFMLDQQANAIRLATVVTSGERIVGALGLGVSVSSPEKELIIAYGRTLKEYAGKLSIQLLHNKRT
jgi:IclR helix-turn-helix domain